MKSTLAILLFGFFLLGSTPVQAMDGKECQTVDVSTNALLAMPVTAKSVVKTSSYSLLASNVKYPFFASICIELKNATAKQEKITIRLDNPRISHAELVSTDEAMPVVLNVAGIDYPLAQWKTYSAEVMFNIDLPPETSRTIQLNLGAKSAYNSQFQISDMPEMLEVLASQQLITGLLAGTILSLVLYSIFLAVTNKEEIYYYLCGSTAFVTLIQLGDLGILYPLWPDAVYWNNVSPLVFAILSTICGVGLARHYLITATHTPRADISLKIYCWYAGLVALPFSLLERFDFNILLFVIPTVCMMAGLIIISTIRIRQGYTPAILYLAALVLPVLGGIAIAATYAGIIPSSPMAKLVPLSATAIQLILFALALGERINWLGEQQKLAALQTLLVSTETSAKKNFQAHISHELRTPIAGIIGLAALAKRSSLYESSKPLIDGIEVSARHLLYTTNMLLDHARIDAGKWAMEQKNFSIRNVVEKIIGKHQDDAEQKHLRITSHTDLDVPETIFGHSDVIERVLDSLVDNAIKFTDAGGVHIMVESIASDKTDFTLRIKVMDTGKGIDTAYRSRIFEVLEQGDSSTTRINQGPGLGLSLSKKFCELAGGDIGFESTSDSESDGVMGTTFWCEFPCQLKAGDTGQSDPPLVGNQAGFMLAGKTVLAAEDDEALSIILDAHLKNLGIPHALFANGKLLFEEYTTCHQEVGALLLDWNMPVFNASQTIKAIREFERNHGLQPVRIIVVSAYDKNSAKEMNLPTDTELLHKPLSANDLRNALLQNP